MRTILHILMHMNRKIKNSFFRTKKSTKKEKKFNIKFVINNMCCFLRIVPYKLITLYFANHLYELLKVLKML